MVSLASCSGAVAVSCTECNKLAIWMFPKIGVPQNGWFLMENPIKMDDFGGKKPIFGNIHTLPPRKDGACHCHLILTNREHPSYPFRRELEGGVSRSTFKRIPRSHQNVVVNGGLQRVGSHTIQKSTNQFFLLTARSNICIYRIPRAQMRAELPIKTRVMWWSFGDLDPST